MNSPKQQLRSCLEDTEKLCTQAQNGEWQALERSLAQRNEALQSVLALELYGQDAAEARELLAKIKTADQQLMALVAENRERVFQQLQKSDQGKKMKTAYGQSKRPG